MGRVGLLLRRLLVVRKVEYVMPRSKPVARKGGYAAVVHYRRHERATMAKAGL